MKYRMIELFAGIGGIRLGFERAFGDEVETVFISEIDEHARKTYLANFPDSKIAGDITKIDAEEIPEFDICLAGFPCQAFSIAGKRGGFDDDYHGTCRGTLFLDVVRICERHKPKIIFCENVKGLVNHDKGNTFKIICSAFEQIGYKIFHAVLNSRDFGLAQNRERIYLVCFRNDIAPEKFEFPAPADESFSIRDVLDYAPIPAKYYLSDVYLETLRKHRARHEAAGNGFGYEIKNLDGVSNALVCGGMGRERNLIVDARPHSTIPTTKIKGTINAENVRKLTPREWARLQGFDEDFNLILSDTQLYKQFGNAVSVNVVEAIATEIRSVLEPMTGNKGEWSELYVLLKILADGGLNAESHGETFRIPVTKIFREERGGTRLVFTLEKFPANNFANDAATILHAIKNYHGKTGAFEIDGAEEILQSLGLTTLKSPANKKADLEVEIHDPRTTQNRRVSYSIKSYLGSPPTLFNASQATNFRFKIPDIDNARADELNRRQLTPKALARSVGRLEFDKVVNETFARNLKLIESRFDEILAEMLKLYYGKGISNCIEIVTRLENDDPLKFGNPTIYGHKLKEFLCAAALALKPKQPWDGTYEANGGYIIINKKNEVIAHPLNDIDEFKAYLLRNTRLDTPKTGRYNFGNVYRNEVDGGGGAYEYFIDLNLQIRFKNSPRSS
ncbi:MAG: HpaII family restriction endonuclease [Selenomonadaceae bacterium]|nr:HpaII family restriction endonuclease [Selenomonadaceae bacterium]